VQTVVQKIKKNRIPACAGMTNKNNWGQVFILENHPVRGELLTRMFS
jgi:hypothetical protein